jgi:hypothetical protein
VAKVVVSHNLSGEFDAVSAGSITVKGNLDNGFVTLSQPLLKAKSRANTLGRLTISGQVIASHVDCAGNIGTVSVGTMESSRIWAGVSPATSGMPMGRGDFVALSDDLLPRIGKITVTGLAGQAYGFGDSSIASWKIGTVSLKDVLTDTPDSTTWFGLSASSLASYTRRVGKVVSARWPTRPASAWPADDLDDFHILRLV